jgi:hypothetical protein
VELVVAKIKRCIDGLERFEVDVDPPLFAFGGYDFTAIDDQAVRRDLGVSFSRCWVEVMAERTDKRLTRDLMLEAVPSTISNYDI